VLSTGIALVAGTAILAYCNGSNDVSKGIATLVGAGVAQYRRAVIWGAAWTLAGALSAAVFSRALVRTFSAGVVSAGGELSGPFAAAVLAGAIAWVLVATRAGLPVSTTHAITGALCGAAVVAAGRDAVLWASLGPRVFLPLLVSPLLSLALFWALYPALCFVVAPLARRCACAEALPGEAAAAAGSSSAVLAAPAAVSLVVDHVENCRARGTALAGIALPDALHWLSSGLTSFARGCNDAPKIVALGLVPGLGPDGGAARLFFAVSLAMAAGSLVAGRRVTETLSRRITPMNAVEGLSANLVTSLLVTLASSWGLPVSTTHVSAGAVAGLGLRRDARAVEWKTVWSVVQAWVVTLPACAALAGAAWWVLAGWAK